MTCKIVSGLWLFIILAYAKATSMEAKATSMEAKATSMEELPQSDKPCTCEGDSWTDATVVCGSDGRLYPNKCFLNCSNIIKNSDIKEVNSEYCKLDLCPCELAVKPVCGTNGVTYRNLCSLKCARVGEPSLKLYQRGECVRRLKRFKRSSGYQKRFQLHTSKKVQACMISN